MITKSFALSLCILALAGPLAAQQPDGGYQKPPANILKSLHAELPAFPLMSPSGDRMILATPLRYPGIQELAQPFLRLAGVRVMPSKRAPHNSPYLTAFAITDIKTGQQTAIKAPADGRYNSPSWSHDGKQFAFLNDSEKSVDLWIADTQTGAARKIPGIQVNRLLGRALVWMSDNRHLLVKTFNPKAGPAPSSIEEISGPSIQESHGKGSASSTYELRDTLKNPQDEKLFAYYGESQLMLLDSVSGKAKPFNKTALYTDIALSPDGQKLLVEQIHKPFSYLTTYSRFPTDVQVWDTKGQVIATVASKPLADKVPIRGVEEGPRGFRWRSNEAATLVYLKALDGGASMKPAPLRDSVMQLRPPYTLPGQEIYKAQQRVVNFDWSETKDIVFISEFDMIKQWIKVTQMNPDQPGVGLRVVEDLSAYDHYQDPGNFVYRPQGNGYGLVLQDGDKVYRQGRGGSPEGDRPFLDRLDLTTLKTERLFQSDKDHLESFLVFLNRDTKQFLTRRESAQEFPNYFVRTVGSDSAPTSVTHFADPLPELRGISKQIVTYKRADGVDLSFNLYLPADYKPGTALPTVLWAYPLDYADAKVAGQVSGSTQEYTMPGWPLQLFFLQAGYAVIDNPSFPVIGDTKKIYDTYMEQLIAGAKAAVDKAVSMGVTDRNRIGVMGHSHGALMTVNLLAHTDLFQAGVARSGAYNRTLTAFGFQNETRTVWEAPDVYRTVSPFFVADKIKRPLLLIHGADDSNPGTTPLQSDKLFEAIRGNGGNVRFVKLPYESHGYRAKESIEHTVWESLNWFDTYVKQAPSSTQQQAAVETPVDKG